MKNLYLFVLFLLVSCCVCTKYDNGVERRATREQHDQGDNIIYPCSVSDIECIRKFFSMHGRCKPVCGSVPDTVKINQLTFPMSTSNISSVVINAKVSGLNGNITSFYINKKTDNLVIAFEAKPLTLASLTITFIYSRKGKEPIKLTDFFYITYSSATFTAVIPSIKDLQLAKSDAYAYLDDNDPQYGLGPGLSNSSNPVVNKAYCDLLAKIPQNGKESLVIQSSNFLKIFIQHKICDFGLKIEK